MRGSTETVTSKKMVEVVEHDIEVTLTMTHGQAEVLRSLTGKMGPRQVKVILEEYSTDNYSVDETMEVIYEFYNVLYETT